MNLKGGALIKSSELYSTYPYRTICRHNILGKTTFGTPLLRSMHIICICIYMAGDVCEVFREKKHGEIVHQIRVLLHQVTSLVMIS